MLWVTKLRGTFRISKFTNSRLNCASIGLAIRAILIVLIFFFSCEEVNSLVILDSFSNGTLIDI